MAVSGMTTLYRRLGGRYPFVFLAVELHSALLIVAGTLALFSFYYQGTTSDYLTVLAIGLVLTEATIVVTLIRVRPQLRPIRAWIDGERDPDSTTRAWASAAGLPIELVKRTLPVPVILSAIRPASPARSSSASPGTP